MDVLEELKKGNKVRKKSWWWGRYVCLTSLRFKFENGDPCSSYQIPSGVDNEWEVYNEKEHGPQNRDPVDAFYEDKYLKEMK